MTLLNTHNRKFSTILIPAKKQLDDTEKTVGPLNASHLILARAAGQSPPMKLKQRQWKCGCQSRTCRAGSTTGGANAKLQISGNRSLSGYQGTTNVKGGVERAEA